jgi:hypothetical protein
MGGMDTKGLVFVLVCVDGDGGSWAVFLGGG